MNELVVVHLHPHSLTSLICCYTPGSNNSENDVNIKWTLFHYPY